MLQNIELKRITAWIAMVAIVFVMLFSVGYIYQHADHDCTGEDCPVCAVMVHFVNNIKNIGTMVATMVVAFFLCLSVQKSKRHVASAYSDCSLISQKVRMNN